MITLLFFMIQILVAEEKSFNQDIKAIHGVSLTPSLAKHPVVVGIIDSGVDISHPALSSHIWHDPKKPSVYGWDFVTNKPNPIDVHGHGTHIAGIIAADFNAFLDRKGICDQVLLMPLRYYSEENSGSKNLEATVNSIYWAVNHGAQIINYSSGGKNFSQQEYNALMYANKKHVLVVVAAGNEHSNIDNSLQAYYPASYQLPNMIVVAALSQTQYLVNSSNWGESTVDLAAPGEKILSDLPHNHVGQLTGTSQATAFVTGVAASLLSINPHLSPEKIKQILTLSVEKIPQLTDKVRSAGVLNMKAAIDMLR